MKNKILVINPGSTSTKVAVFEDEELKWDKTIRHSAEELSPFNRIIDQLTWRQQEIEKILDKAGFNLNNFKAIVARGGVALDPVKGGTYRIDEEILNDLKAGKNGEHASNLAGIIAYNLAQKIDIPAFTVDPVAVDEFEPLARLSGLPELPRRCQSHALNLKAIGRKVAKELGKNIKNINLIGVHLGGGISVAALKGGRIVDVNNANQAGPYSPERVGTLPVLDLVNYIYREEPKEEEMKKRLIGQGGLMAYLGENDGVEIEKRISQGERKAKLAYDGMIYQIGKEIGAMAVVLTGRIEAIFLTGGLAHSNYVVNGIKDRVGFLAPVRVYPGAEEMLHLAAGALRVLRGEEKPLSYQEGRVKTDIF